MILFMILFKFLHVLIIKKNYTTLFFMGDDLDFDFLVDFVSIYYFY